MAYTRLSAAEAAAMINDQDTIGLSGFTPNGVPKATFRELSKRAVAEHEAGRPFQVGINFSEDRRSIDDWKVEALA